MHLIFKNVTQQQLFGIKRIGDIHEYVVGELPDHIKDVVKLDHMHFRKISEEVAHTIHFALSQQTYIKVKKDQSGNPLWDHLLESIEIGEDEESKKYYMTETDNANAVILMQTYMRLYLDDVYDNRVRNDTLGVSNIELYSWDQQRSEAEKYIADNTASVPLLDALATARGITTSEMATKVNTAVSNYYGSLKTNLAKIQQIEKEIKDCTTRFDCHKLLFTRFNNDIFGVLQSRKIEAGLSADAVATYDL